MSGSFCSNLVRRCELSDFLSEQNYVVQKEIRLEMRIALLSELSGCFPRNYDYLKLVQTSD